MSNRKKSPPSATAAGDAWSFSTDFLGLGSRRVVDVALHRPTRKVTNRRLTRGVYDFPKHHPRLERRRREPWPGQSPAATMCDFSPPAPMPPMRWGSPPRCRRTWCFSPMESGVRVGIGGMTIQLRRTTPRNTEPAGRLSGLLIQAFRELGKEHVTPERIAHLKRTLPAGDRRKLLDDLRLAPTWMHRIFRDLAAQP